MLGHAWGLPWPQRVNHTQLSACQHTFCILTSLCVPVQMAVVLEYMDGGTLADVLSKVNMNNQQWPLASMQLSCAQQQLAPHSFGCCDTCPAHDAHTRACFAARADVPCLAPSCLQLGRIPEDVLAVITGRILQGLVFMHAKHMVSSLLEQQRPAAVHNLWAGVGHHAAWSSGSRPAYYVNQPLCNSKMS